MDGKVVAAWNNVPTWRIFGFMGISTLERLRCTRQRRRIGVRLEAMRNDLYRVALAWCGDAMLADDLTQETLARAWDNCHQLQDEEKLAGWTHKVLMNCWRTHLRRFRPMEDLDSLVLTSPESPDLSVSRGETISRVRQAIQQLPLGQRETLVLVDLQGLSYAQTAEILDIPSGTVMSRLARARVALKERLKDELGPESRSLPQHLQVVS